MLDLTVAIDKLVGMESSDEIAGFFLDQGVKAVAGLANACAIARWVTDSTGTQVHVNQDSIWTYEDTTNLTGQQTLVECTPAMLNFVNEFDAGRYPDLFSADGDRFVRKDEE